MAYRPYLPLRVNESTPSVIKCADGRSIPISWSRHPADNPYAEAEEAASFVARACNTHDALKGALELAIYLIEDAMKDTNWTPDGMGDEGKTIAELRAALSLAEEKQ